MAAAPPQIDPAAELAALRVRAAALGASADTPDACLPEFETFSGKVLPLFEKNACGIDALPCGAHRVQVPRLDDARHR